MKILKAIGLIVLFLAVYQLAQLIIMMAAGVFHMVTQFSEIAASGSGLVLDDVIAEMTTFLTAQTPWVLLLSIAITVPTYYLFYKERREELWTFLSFRSIGALSIPVLIIFSLSVSFILDVVLTILSQLDAFSQVFDYYEQVSEMIFGGGFVLSLISIGIVAPVFEEIMFRGLIFGELRKITPVKIALVIQALLFGAYHLNLIQGVYTFLLGLLIGYVYYRSNSIIAPILMHVSINSGSVIINEFVSTQQLETWGVVIMIASVALFFLTGAFILTGKSFKRCMDDSLFQNNRRVKKIETDSI